MKQIFRQLWCCLRQALNVGSTLPQHLPPLFLQSVLFKMLDQRLSKHVQARQQPLLFPWVIPLRDKAFAVPQQRLTVVCVQIKLDHFDSTLGEL